MDRADRLLASSDKEPFDGNLIWPADFIADLKKLAKDDKKLKEALYDKDFKEIADSFSFLALISYLTKKVYLIGKIKNENYPYDVMIVPVEDIDIKYGKTLIHKHFLLQNKTTRMGVVHSLEELKDDVQKEIDKASRTQPHIRGILHILMTPPFAIKITGTEIDDVLKQIKIPERNSFSHIVFTLEYMIDNERHSEIWYLHPEFRPGFHIAKEEMKEVEKIYTAGTSIYMKYMAKKLLYGIENMMLALSPWDFDRTFDGWPQFADAEAYEEGAMVVRHYILKNLDWIKNPKSGEKKIDLEILYFHLGQLLASAGQEKFPEAIKSFQQSFLKDDECWNAYVTATIGFLEKDRDKIEMQISIIEKLKPDCRNLKIMKDSLKDLDSPNYGYKLTL